MGPRYDGTPGETDPVILARRVKQIDYGKNSGSYVNYVKHIPREERFEGCPKTPDRYAKASRRSFDTMVRRWKIDVHGWSDAIKAVEKRRSQWSSGLLEESPISHPSNRIELNPWAIVTTGTNMSS